MHPIHNPGFFSIFESDPPQLFAPSRLSKVEIVFSRTIWLATAITNHASPSKELLDNNNLPRNCLLEACFVLWVGPIGLTLHTPQPVLAERHIHLREKAFYLVASLCPVAPGSSPQYLVVITLISQREELPLSTKSGLSLGYLRGLLGLPPQCNFPLRSCKPRIK